MIPPNVLTTDTSCAPLDTSKSNRESNTKGDQWLIRHCRVSSADDRKYGSLWRVNLGWLLNCDCLDASPVEGLDLDGVPTLPLTLERGIVVESSTRRDHAGQGIFFIFTIIVADDGGRVRQAETVNRRCGGKLK